MPAKSKQQQKAAGAALSAKRGETKKSELRGASRDMYESMSESKLEDMASVERRKLPKRASSKSGGSNSTRSRSGGSGSSGSRSKSSRSGGSRSGGSRSTRGKSSGSKSTRSRSSGSRSKSSKSGGSRSRSRSGGSRSSARK